MGIHDGQTLWQEFSGSLEGSQGVLGMIGVSVAREVSQYQFTLILTY
jgi:hypothetical protein